MAKKRILIVEDDRDIALLLRHSLEKDGGFEVETAFDGPTGLQDALRHPPDLVLLDLHLPEMDGLDVCRRLRSDVATANVPMIMLTARADESDRVSGLELGADDYVTKPFSIKEVMARIRAVLRRAHKPPEGGETLQSGSLIVDPASRRVTVGGDEIVMTRKEFDLLADLMRHRGRVLSRERLLERVWGYHHPGTTRTVDVHVRQLRRKLGDPVAKSIDTVVGVGYRFVEQDA